jgi:hypothetical protein
MQPRILRLLLRMTSQVGSCDYFHGRPFGYASGGQRIYDSKF